MAKIKPQPIFTSIWGNKATIKVFCYDKPLRGEYKNDRIQVLIKPAYGKQRGWLMTAEEAIALIYGLSKAVSLNLENRQKTK